MANHPAFVDMTGKRCGVVVATERASNDGHGNARWRCRCDVCGEEHILIGTQIRSAPPRDCPAKTMGRPGRPRKG